MSIDLISNSIAIREHNKIFNTINRIYRFRAFENYATEFTYPTFEERYSVVCHTDVFTEFYGPLSFPILDRRQTTFARLTDSEMLTGLKSVLKRDVPLVALLPTFVGMARLCQLLRIRFVVERNCIRQCLSCLAQDCNCFIFSFHHFPLCGCVCGDMLCSCDYFPPPLLFLDELSEVFTLRAPEAYEFLRVDVVPALGDEDFNDVHSIDIGYQFVIGPFTISRLRIVVLVQIYEPSNFQPP